MGKHLIRMPDVGEGIAEVEITEWSVSEGDSVAEDQELCIVMTDKAAVEIPSPVDGVVAWLGAKAGEIMAVGSDLIILEVDGEGNTSDSTAAPEDSAKKAAAEAKRETGKPNAGNRQAEGLVAPGPERARPLASPAVRRRAREAGIDLSSVPASGPARRITHEDLDAVITAGTHAPSAAGVRAPNTFTEDHPVSGLRAEIARRLQSTKQRVPHYSYVEAVDVTELQRLRERLNQKYEGDKPRLTLLPFIVQALVRSLAEYPDVNAHFDDAANSVRRYGAIHAGIATQTDRGLVVTVVRHAESLSLFEIAGEIWRLANAARAGTAKREELTGSTITLSSLGPYGGIATTPIINAPELAVIGINKIERRPVWDGNRFIPREMMNLSSSFDHRIIDGWKATQFIQHLKGLLESPAEIFLEI